MIEPGDDAGYLRDYDRAVCETCLDDNEDDDEYPEPLSDWRAGS